MFATVASVSSLFAGTFILLLGMGLMGTVLGVRAGIEEFSDAVTGVVMGAYFLGFTIGAFLCPPIIQRVGHIRAFAAMASVASTTSILHAMLVEPLAWAFLRVLTGTCLVGLYMVIESWLNTLTPSEKRGRVFAFYMMISLAALGLGQFLIVVADVRTFVSFGLISVLMSLSLVPIAMTRVVEPRSVQAPRLSLIRLVQRSPTGAVGAIAAGLATGGFWGLGPLFAHRIGLSEIGIAGFMGAVIFGGALLQWPIGHLSDNHDRRRVLAGVALAAAAVALLMFLAAPRSQALLFAGAFLYGGLAFTVYGLAVAHVNDRLDASEVLEATKGLLLLHGLGATAGPMLAGLLTQALGARSLLVFFAVVFALAAGFAWLRMRTAGPIAVAAQSGFVPMSRTSTAVLEMDPRVEGESEEAAAGGREAG